MKKVLSLSLVLVSMFCFSAMGATVSYTFSQEHTAQIIEGTCYLHKNTETKPNPAYVPETIEVDGEMVQNPEYVGEPETLPAFTNAQWTKEWYRRAIIRTAVRGLERKDLDERVKKSLPDEAVE